MSAEDKCYACAHARAVPLSAHIECTHPLRHREVPHFVAELAGGRAATNAPAPLNIAGNKTGLLNGWFAWPISFDPVWLDRCDGFEESA